MNTKPWYSSKTLWFNLLVLIGSLLGTTLDSDLVKQNPQLVGALGAVVGGINILIRLVTNSTLVGK